MRPKAPQGGSLLSAGVALAREVSVFGHVDEVKKFFKLGSRPSAELRRCGCGVPVRLPVGHRLGLSLCVLARRGPRSLFLRVPADRSAFLLRAATGISLNRQGCSTDPFQNQGPEFFLNNAFRVGEAMREPEPAQLAHAQGPSSIHFAEPGCPSESVTASNISSRRRALSTIINRRRMGACVAASITADSLHFAHQSAVVELLVTQVRLCQLLITLHCSSFSQAYQPSHCQQRTLRNTRQGINKTKYVDL